MNTIRRIESFLASMLAFVLLILALVPTLAADPMGQTAPTLVPPTLVPTLEMQTIDALPSESGVARIARDGVVRVGILFNEPQFGELNVRGDISGVDADLARSIAESWGVTAEFTQVTRQTGIDMLAADEIDLLMAAQPHLRDLDTRVEFSESYYPSAQVMLIRESDPMQTLGDMANRNIGFIMGTRSELALGEWTRRSGIAVNPVPFVNFDQALAGLNMGAVDGLIANRMQILRAVTQPGIARILAEQVMPEPYAIGVRRQDVNLRNLVNQTLQYLLQSGRINEIHRAHFNNVDFPSSPLFAWANIGDTPPTPADAATDVPFPSQYIVPRLQTERVLRVAGIQDVPPDAPESVRRMDTAHRALINEIARRWNVSVVYVPDNGASPLDLVANGQADIAVGVTPDWANASRVDFTQPYLTHGYQLMIEAGSNVAGFGDLRSRAIGVFADEPNARDVLRLQAEAARALLDDIYTLANESDAAYAMLASTELNLFAVFGDSIRLLPHLQANPDTLALLTDADDRPIYFSRDYLAMATPHNDLDFHLLLEYTLQEMAADGTLTSILSPVTLPEGIPMMEYWAGSNNTLGFAPGR
jgi:polar amino acid transport system substrate-binding protein